MIVRKRFIELTHIAKSLFWFCRELAYRKSLPRWANGRSLPPPCRRAPGPHVENNWKDCTVSHAAGTGAPRSHISNDSRDNKTPDQYERTPDGNWRICHFLFTTPDFGALFAAMTVNFGVSRSWFITDVLFEYNAIISFLNALINLFLYDKSYYWSI